MRFLAALLWLSHAVTAAAQLSPAEAKEGFVALFDGTGLSGWEGNRALWSVRDGCIVGNSDTHPFQVNTFLIYKQPFANFILRAEVRLRNHNSGIQFRSTHLPGPDWIVYGYQADLSDEPGREAWGNFYEERGRSRTMMKTPDEGWLKARTVVDPHGWNRYEILADGNHIRLTLNGVVTMDTHDDKTASGLIALQLHGGKPMQVEYRNIRIKVLP